jgi:hypothetical protein
MHDKYTTALKTSKLIADSLLSAIAAPDEEKDRRNFGFVPPPPKVAPEQMDEPDSDEWDRVGPKEI